jgi:hypothetical protein
MPVKFEPSPNNVPPLIVVADKTPFTVKPLTASMYTLKFAPLLLVNVIVLVKSL